LGSDCARAKTALSPTVVRALVPSKEQGLRISAEALCSQADVVAGLDCGFKAGTVLADQNRRWWVCSRSFELKGGDSRSTRPPLTVQREISVPTIPGPGSTYVLRSGPVRLKIFHRFRTVPRPGHSSYFCLFRCPPFLTAGHRHMLAILNIVPTGRAIG